MNCITDAGKEVEPSLIQGGLNIEDRTFDNPAFQEILDLLSEDERHLGLLKLDGYNNFEVAQCASWASKKIDGMRQ
ncbi:MAG: hypothetical protein ACOWWR_05945 [Eubacteriales bacterium]